MKKEKEEIKRVKSGVQHEVWQVGGGGEEEEKGEDEVEEGLFSG